MEELIYPRLFLPAAEQFSHKTMVADQGHEATMDEHADRVLRLASALKSELGVEPTDRFAVMATNSHQFLELYHAAFLGAGVINPLNLRLDARDLEGILADAGAKVCFVDGFFASKIDEIREAAGLQHVVLMGSMTEAPHDVTFEQLIEAGSPQLPPEPAPDQIASLTYTGGTQGRPKGVVMDQRSHILNLYHLMMVLEFSDQRRFLHQTPMFHIASMGGILAVPTRGGFSTFVPMFEPNAVMSAIEQHRVDWTVMVPTMMAMLLDHPDFEPERLATLKDINYGASPIPKVVLKRLMELYPDLRLSQGYGATEAPALTLLYPHDHEREELLTSVGRPVPGVQFRIQDSEGKQLPPGEVGEVCVTAGHLMQGYWNQPEETEKVFTDGWYHTGDAGYLDDEGFLFLVDRIKDMIITGGENVYSAEVEDAIATHPDVEQVAVIGVPHRTWGEAVHAVVVPREGAELTEEAVIAHARERIAGYKVPKSVELREGPLPMSGAMKIMKRELRSPYWEEQ